MLAEAFRGLSKNCQPVVCMCTSARCHDRAWIGLSTVWQKPHDRPFGRNYSTIVKTDWRIVKTILNIALSNTDAR